MIEKAIAIALTCVCVIGASACNRPAWQQHTRDNQPTHAKARPSVHPSVPGRNFPCPREGGLNNAGYPCEPTRS
jgi:hypothetical protein